MEAPASPDSPFKVLGETTQKFPRPFDKGIEENSKREPATLGAMAVR